jgi:hypothetical protein
MCIKKESFYFKKDEWRGLKAMKTNGQKKANQKGALGDENAPAGLVSAGIDPKELDQGCDSLQQRA